MGAKQQWGAKIRQVRDHVRHTYFGNTMTGFGHVVAVRLELETPGQHNGREVWAMLLPEDARRIAESLNAQADYADKKNKEI